MGYKLDGTCSNLCINSIMTSYRGLFNDAFLDSKLCNFGWKDDR